MTREGDKIFARVTSIYLSVSGIYYPFYSYHFIHDSCIEFVVKNCVHSVLMIIENRTPPFLASTYVERVTNYNQARFHKNLFVPAQKKLSVKMDFRLSATADET